MAELKWRIDWYLGVDTLDNHHTNVFKLINELLLLTDNKKQTGQSVKMFNPVVDIGTAQQHFNQKKINTLIDDLFFPLICDLKSEITKFLGILESTDMQIMDSSYHLHKNDYMMLMAELKHYIRHVRDDGVLDSAGVQQIRTWFIMHMRCFKKMLGNSSLL